MTLFYFDIHDSDGLHRDNIGDDFDGFKEACDQVQALLTAIIRDELPSGDQQVVSCAVRDEDGRVVYRGKMTYEGIRVSV